MKKLLENIQKIKHLAKTKCILNIVIISIIIIFAITKNIIIPSLPYSYSPVYHTLSKCLSVFIIIFVVFIVGANLVLAILLLVNSTSIYISSKKNNDEEVIEKIRLFKMVALICSILSIFFGLMLDVVIWVLSNTNIKFLKEKIEEQKENKTE